MNSTVWAALAAGFLWALWRARPKLTTVRLVRAQVKRSAPSLTVVLRMMSVALSSGVSIPRSLAVVGTLAGGAFGASLRSVSTALLQGLNWRDAWVAARQGDSEVVAAGKDVAVLRDALEDAWVHGASPIGRLESAVEQMDASRRHHIERAAAELSVKLLMPTGLCFLPAFILIGVIPSIASFTV